MSFNTVFGLHYGDTLTYTHLAVIMIHENVFQVLSFSGGREAGRTSI